MKELAVLFENNQKWAKHQSARDTTYFERLSREQTPKYLWIGCADSRVPANEIVGLEAGELFVHRNIANLCIHTDFSFLSVLEYAINKLKIEHVIVCGHYGCGGVEAALGNEEVGLADNWLRNIRDLVLKYEKELAKEPDHRKKIEKLVEINVKEQVKNICHSSIVQKAWKEKKQHLCVHGWVYDLGNGLLKDLQTTFSELEEIPACYRVYT